MAALKFASRAAGLADRLAAALQRALAAARRGLWVTALPRSWAEAGLLMAVLLGLVLLPMMSAPDSIIPATFLLFTLLCGALAGLRLRLLPGPWPAALAREALLSITLAALLIAVCAGILWVGGAWWLLEHSVFPPGLTLLILGICIPAFLTLRILARLWLWWDALRRRRFVWALTQAQLTVIVLLGVMVLLAGLGTIAYTVHVELQDLASLPGSPPYSILMQIIIWLLGLTFLSLFLTGLGILVLLPPALLFSYLVARGLTRRVETLAQAAARLRSGDFGAHVTVEGQDELAQLQENFNVMAADLRQRTKELEVRTQELRLERDRTGALLNAHRQLAASVSHELRTPVATARAYLDSLLERRADETIEDARRDLEVISGEVDRLERLIDDLFTLSRAEIDRLSLDIRPVEVRPLLRRLVEMVDKPAWEQRRVQVMLADGLARQYVLADPLRLEQVMRNLLQNSLRHTPPGGYVLVSAETTVSTETTTASEPMTSGLRISVEDSGEGIHPDDLPHIWERFYRADTARVYATRASGEGAGLGLALVKELVEAMGGRVGVESCPGQGSQFWVVLPACDTIATDS